MPDAEDWRDELVALLSSPNQDDWKKAFALRNAHRPSRLYRYREAIDYTFSTLSHQSIWLSEPAKFNDLLDSSVVADAIRGMNFSLKNDLAAARIKLPAEMIARLEKAEDPIGTLDQLFAESIREKVGQEKAERLKDFFRNHATTHSAEMSVLGTKWFQSKSKVTRLLWNRTGPHAMRGCVVARSP